jgi:PhnB protein
MSHKVPPGREHVIPNLIVKGVAEAITFYEKAFGAEEVMRMPGPGGKGIMHLEFKIAASLFFMADEAPTMSCHSPHTLKGTPVSMYLYVEDVDKVFNQAVASGAKAIMPPTNLFWGDRYCKVADPFGHEWSLATHLEDVSIADMARRSKEFFQQFKQPQQ